MVCGETEGNTHKGKGTMDHLIFAIFLLFAQSSGTYQDHLMSGQYVISDKDGLGRRFDGIGGLSGGGATSKLLINYPEPQRTQILDYLFLPGFAASLQILKVEIGGDDQSTDGSESSHQHNEWDPPNYHRGYEWWLMKEAKKRNPEIKLWGLSWAWPGYLGTNDPWENLTATAEYTIGWVKGAKSEHGLDIDYIGTLRKELDAHGLNQVQISAPDTGFGDFKQFAANQTVMDAIVSFGSHYPGTFSTKQAVDNGKPIWSSEDYSTFNDDVGAGCWARLLNRNYVNGHMTSTISWNLITSYYRQLPYTRNGLMDAMEPWSGHYDVRNPIWISAHRTQFTKIGWKYLKHGQGVGHLDGNGTFVALTDPPKRQLTIVVETMIKNYRFTVQLDVDSIHTFSTISPGNHPNTPKIPSSAPFPLPYSDNFDHMNISSEPFNLAQQIGAWEIEEDKKTDLSNAKKNRFVRQKVLQTPVTWCTKKARPLNVIGSGLWRDVNVTVSFRVPFVNGTKGVMIGGRAMAGGCDGLQRGALLWVFPKSDVMMLSTDMERSKVFYGHLLPFKIKHDQWYNASIAIKDETMAVSINGHLIASPQDLPMSLTRMKCSGTNSDYCFVTFGSDNFGLFDLDNLRISSP